jgi:hypothetical protein
MNRRYLYFGAAVAAGLALGLLYGWVLSPIEYVDASPNTLRIDYKADFVLAVAEAYSVEGDPLAAVRRLGLLGSPTPRDAVDEAILFAIDVGYAPADLDMMRELARAIETWNPAIDSGVE